MSKLGQLLVARSWITVQQLTRALQNQHAVGGRLGTCLLEMEVLGEDLLARSLSEQLGVPAAAVDDLRGIPEEVLHLIPEKLARRCRVIPFRVAGGRLDVAMQDPRNLVCQDEIAFASGRRVKVHVLHELRIYEAMQRYYREECPSRHSLLLDRLNRARYLWGAKEGAARTASGVPAVLAAQARAGGAADARDAEDRTEVLSALTPEGLLAGAPRMQPPPLGEPALPPLPRRRSLFRRGVAPPAAAGSAGAGTERELPPLEELDLRPPARQRQREPGPPRDERSAAAPAVTVPEAGAPEPIGPPEIAAPAMATAGAVAARPAAEAAVSAGSAAPGAGAPMAAAAGKTAPSAPEPDLEATLALGPPPLTRARGGATTPAAAAPGPAEPRRATAAEAPHPKVTLTDAERAELGLDDTLPAPPAPTPAPAASTATLEEVEQALAATADREEVGRILLDYLARGFRRVALFQATRLRVTAWMAHGDGIDQEAFGRYAVSFKEPSVFLNLQQGSGIHIGPLAPMASHRELALSWGGGLPRDCLVLPVRLRDRLVMVVYVDGGSRGLGGVDLERMQRLMAAAAAAFERCILTKKHGYPQS